MRSGMALQARDTEKPGAGLCRLRVAHYSLYSDPHEYRRQLITRSGLERPATKLPAAGPRPTLGRGSARMGRGAVSRTQSILDQSVRLLGMGTTKPGGEWMLHSPALCNRLG